MTRSQLSTVRQRLFSESMVVIAKAIRNEQAVPAGLEARRLLQEHPDCGLSEEDIREHLVRLAVENRLAVDTAT